MHVLVKQETQLTQIGTRNYTFRVRITNVLSSRESSMYVCVPPTFQTHQETATKHTFQNTLLKPTQGQYVDLPKSALLFGVFCSDRQKENQIEIQTEIMKKE